MRCQNEKCNVELLPGEEREIHGRILCEDCYMDVLSPPRTCDPWAVRSASMSRDVGKVDVVSEVQGKILRMLAETNGTDLETLSYLLGMRPGDVEREIAALRHMEKIRAALRDGRKIIRIW